MKYIYSAFDGGQQLFNLDKDPGEVDDLEQDAAHADTLKKWRGRVVKHLSERGEPFEAILRDVNMNTGVICGS